MGTRALHAALLLVAGFVGGLWVVSVFTDHSPLNAKAPELLASADGTNACVPDQTNEEDEIFFLSCGGIF